MAKETKIYYGPLVEGSQEFYTDLVNVDFSIPPYAKLAQTNRLFLRRRKGYNLWQRIDGPPFGLEDDSSRRIGDMTEVDGILYFSKISPNSKKIRIYAGTADANGCYEFEMLTEECFCPGGFDQFVKTDFVKGVPRDSLVNIATDNCKGIQINKQVVTGSYALLEGRFAHQDIIDNPGMAGVHRNWNGTAANSIRPGDYLYIYSNEGNGFCGQVNIVKGYDNINQQLIMTDPWVMDPGILNADGTYAQDPQLEGKYVCYAVFPEYGETVAFMTCEGPKTFSFNSTGVTDPYDPIPFALGLCSFDKCYDSFIEYQGQNGNGHFSFFDSNNGVVVYGLPGTQKAYFHSFTPLPSSIKGMGSFQNYGVYFGKNFFGAYYITKDESGNFIMNGNPVRDNLGGWINSNDKMEAFTQFLDSFYFVGSNKHIYTLSIIPTNFGTLTFKLDDLTDDAFCKWILGDLEALRPGDDVHIQADDDIFRVFINHKNGNGPKTKILTYNKRYKIWTKHYLCCALIKAEFEGKFYGDDIYHYCGNTDCDYQDQVGAPIEGLIRWNLGDDVSGGNQKVESFSNKILDWIQIQIGRNTDSTENTRLIIYSERGLYRPKFELDGFEDNPYISTLNGIMNGVSVEVPECNVLKLKPCEEFVDPCEGSKEPYSRLNANCQCPEDFVGEHCICIENKKYAMADFVNLHTKLNGMEGKMYTFELRFTDLVEFGGCMIQYQLGDYGESTECEKRYCKNCDTPERCCHKPSSRSCTP